MNTTVKVQTTELQDSTVTVTPTEVSTTDAATITKQLLTRDRERATDVLLQLRYQFSRTVSTIEVK